ncbi:MAG: SDR family oxidoreductase [Myxococcota bacterium]|nr:SDR family oxidoreductase [Myxococcota bacterium]
MTGYALKVAITGISGRFGRLVGGRLHRRHSVVGIDRRSISHLPKDIEFHCIDIRRKRCESIFREHQFDAVVHLNIIHNPRASSQAHHSFNLKGTDRIMEYCVRFGVRKLVILSSANVYGPRPDNTQFLTEDAPLMGSERFSKIRALVAVDMHAQSFFWKHPQVETVILRPVHILGSVKNAPSNYLRLKRPWVVAGFDPMVQVIHENDVARAIEACLTPGIQGIFNVAGCPPTALSELLQRAGCQPVPVPHLIADTMLERLWKMRLTTFPAPELDHLRYVCMVDGTRATKVLRFEPTCDLDETIQHVLAIRKV